MSGGPFFGADKPSLKKIFQTENLKKKSENLTRFQN
jgi:hypothetical protein